MGLHRIALRYILIHSDAVQCRVGGSFPPVHYHPHPLSSRPLSACHPLAFYYIVLNINLNNSSIICCPLHHFSNNYCLMFDFLGYWLNFHVLQWLPLLLFSTEIGVICRPFVIKFWIAFFFLNSTSQTVAAWCLLIEVWSV